VRSPHQHLPVSCEDEGGLPTGGGRAASRRGVALGALLGLTTLVAGCAGSGLLGGDTEPTPEPVDDDPGSAFDCDAPLDTSVPNEVVLGITSAEDFVFAADGGVLSVDLAGNLVRSDRGIGTALVAPGVTSTETAGISMLPGGDLVIADVGRGAVVRVTPEGGVSTVLSGLAYPNGLEVHRDGWIAVAEQDAGAVRRVDPDSGEFVILATGLFNPNGVSFSPDYGTLYVNSFGGGTVQAIPLDGAGAAGPPVLLGQIELDGVEPPPWGWDPWRAACDGLVAGEPCVLVDQPGSCVNADGEVHCNAPDPFVAACEGLAAGTPCALAGQQGLCEEWDGQVSCDNRAWWPGGGGGGLDGIAVDACGSVYVTEFEAGLVWRWSAQGDGPELVAELPDSWIPSMDFGVGAGDWDVDKLWVVSRDGGRIFGVHIGVPGRPLAHIAQ
jgi:sugar lactone lactonase YvrE